MPVYCSTSTPPPQEEQEEESDPGQRVWREPKPMRPPPVRHGASRAEDLPAVACSGSYL